MEAVIAESGSLEYKTEEDKHCRHLGQRGWRHLEAAPRVLYGLSTIGMSMGDNGAL